MKMLVLSCFAALVAATPAYGDRSQQIEALDRAQSEFTDLVWDLPFQHIEDGTMRNDIRQDYRQATEAIGAAKLQLDEPEAAIAMLLGSLETFRMVSFLLPFYKLDAEICAGVIDRYRSNEATLRFVVADLRDGGTGEIEIPEDIIVLSSDIGRSIPDNNATGIVHALHVSSDHSIAGLSVAVTVEHSVPSDLLLTLIHPDGTPIDLGRMSGAEQVFGVGGRMINGILELVGKPANGVFKLKVADVAGQDIGLLQSVKLAIVPDYEIAAEGEESGTAETTIAVPDNNAAGVTVAVLMRKSGPVDAIQIRVGYDHPVPSDLQFTLVSPGGITIDLGRAELAGESVFGVGGVWLDALEQLLGTDMHGIWQLKAADVAGQDIGTLNRFEVIVNPGS